MPERQDQNLVLIVLYAPSSLGSGVQNVAQLPNLGSRTDLCSSQFENHYFTKMCSGSEAGSNSRLIDFVYHSTLGLRVIKNK